MDILLKTPKHISIASEIREMIFSGKIGIGNKLPPDAEMAKKYDCNKRIVARAMTMLASEGYISRKSGRGTIVVSSSAAPQEPEKKKSHAVCILASNSGHFYSDISAGIEKHLLDADLYPVWIREEIYKNSITFGCEKNLLYLIENMLQDKPYGFIIDADRFLPLDFFREHISEMGKVVFFNHYQYEERLPGRYCLVNYFLVGSKIASFYAERGFKRLAYIPAQQKLRHSPFTKSPHEQIVDGMDDFCRKNGLYFDVQCAYRLFDGEPLVAVMKDMQKKNMLPEAVAVHSDIICFNEVLPVCASLDIRVPEDMSVLGFFNTPLCQCTVPKLSSVDLCPEYMAQEAVKMLLADVPHDVTLAMNIIERGSTSSKLL